MNKRHVLLVEGPHDKHVLYALAAHHKLPDECFKIETLNGLDALRTRLRSRVGEEERLGIVLDADVELTSRWQSIQEQVRKALGSEALLLPTQPSPEGTVITLPDGRRLGIWLMPNNQLPGNLEHFLAFLRPAGDQLLPLVDSFLSQLPSAEDCPQRFPDKDRMKARIHAYLALQKEPGKPLGQAITARYLDADAPEAQTLVEWLRRLFVP